MNPPFWHHLKSFENVWTRGRVIPLLLFNFRVEFNVGVNLTFRA
jgi:hypothetical protein